MARESGWLWACSVAADRLGVPVAMPLWPARTVSAADLHRQIEAILMSWGLEEESARAAAERIAWADLRGIDSHGAAMMPFYHRRLRAGRLVARPRIEIVRESDTTALVDGGGGLGHLAAAFAMRLAIDKARASGLGAVAVRSSWHFGAAGSYAAEAVASGMVGIATTATPTPCVVPTFAAGPLLGTNPIAFAAPAGGDAPFLLDMATSTVSRGKLLERWRRGRRVPDGWAIDADGRPVANGWTAFHDGRLTPLGARPETASHKGYGLAVLVEILSNVLPGIVDDREDPLVDDGSLGHFFLALDPDRFLAAGTFGAAVERVLARLRGATPIDRAEPVRVAGDPERETLARRTREGVPLARPVFEDLRHVARASGAPFVLG